MPVVWGVGLAFLAAGRIALRDLSCMGGADNDCRQSVNYR